MDADPGCANAAGVSEVLTLVADDLRQAAAALADAGLQPGKRRETPARVRRRRTLLRRRRGEGGPATGRAARVQAARTKTRRLRQRLAALLRCPAWAGAARIRQARATSATRYAIVQVVIRDQPGASWPGFSRRPGEAGVNIEDMRHRALAGTAVRRSRAGGQAWLRPGRSRWQQPCPPAAGPPTPRLRPGRHHLHDHQRHIMRCDAPVSQFVRVCAAVAHDMCAHGSRSRPRMHRVAECLVIAVDGPSGSGKSSAARGTAQALGLRYLDTGAMYRALTWWLLARHVDVDVMRPGGGGQRWRTPATGRGEHRPRRVPSVTVDGADVTRPIRGRPVSNAVSAVASVPEVRRHLIARQREIIARACAETGGIVAEGRDIGTVVAPDATVKVFLTASAGIRRPVPSWASPSRRGRRDPGRHRSPRRRRLRSSGLTAGQGRRRGRGGHHAGDPG